MAKQKRKKPQSQRPSRTTKTVKKTLPTTKPATIFSTEHEPWTPWGKWAKRRRARIDRKRQERAERKRLRRLTRQRWFFRQRLITTRIVVFLGLGVIACTVAGGVLLIMGKPYPWQAVQDMIVARDAAADLPAQQSRWESLAIEDYNLMVEYQRGNIRCGPYTVEIRDTHLITHPGSGDSWFQNNTCESLFEAYTVDGSFTWLSEQHHTYQPGASYFTVTFDPDFGYPTQAQGGVYDDSQGEECCWIMRWWAMQVWYEEDKTDE